MNALPSVLVADDQPDIRTSLQLALKGAGFDARMADSPEAVLAAVRAHRYDVLLMDLNYTRDTTSGGEGLDLLEDLKAVDRDLPVVAMTAWATIDLAIEAMRRGAGDFVLKPWDNAALLRTVRKQVETRRDRTSREIARTRELRDMDTARRVQARLLPQVAPRLRTVEMAAHCVEAGAIGGDGYDFIELGSGRTAIVLGDVAGKGTPGAILWASLQAALRSRSSDLVSDPVAVLADVNRLFFETTAPEHFATLFLGVYDDTTRELRYVNCGHNAPILVRGDESETRLASSAPALGMMAKWSGESRREILRSGDTLIIYSDGVTEATGPEGDEFGESRLGVATRELRSQPLRALPEALLSRVNAFAPGEAQDDRTIVAIRAIAQPPMI